MERRLLLAMALLCVAPLRAGEDPLRADVPPDTTPGCLPAAAGSDALLPDATDLADGVVHYGVLRDCTEGRPPRLTLDLVQYFEGAEAVRAAAADGVVLEPDVDPVSMSATAIPGCGSWASSSMPRSWRSTAPRPAARPGRCTSTHCRGARSTGLHCRTA